VHGVIISSLLKSKDDTHIYFIKVQLWRQCRLSRRAGGKKKKKKKEKRNIARGYRIKESEVVKYQRPRRPFAQPPQHFSQPRDMIVSDESNYRGTRGFAISAASLVLSLKALIEGKRASIEENGTRDTRFSSAFSGKTCEYAKKGPNANGSHEGG
jgi:hypothetical protein